MAIRKGDVSHKLSRLQRDELRRLEDEIDWLLFEQYAGEPLIVDFKDMTRRIDPRVVTALRRRYERAGWKCVFLNLKRGNFGGIEFS